MDQRVNLVPSYCSHDPSSALECPYLESMGFRDPKLNTYWYPSTMRSKHRYSQWTSADYRYELVHGVDGDGDAGKALPYRIQRRLRGDGTRGNDMTDLVVAVEPRVLCPSMIHQWWEGGRANSFANFKCMAARPSVKSSGPRAVIDLTSLSVYTGGPVALAQIALSLSEALADVSLSKSIATLDSGSPESYRQSGIHCTRPRVRCSTDRAHWHLKGHPTSMHRQIIAEYPFVEHIPTLHSSELHRGDLLVLQETLDCPRDLVQRGVTVAIYLLSDMSVESNQRFLDAGCHLIAHSYWLSTREGAHIKNDLPMSNVIRPYMHDRMKILCKNPLNKRRSNGLPSVLIDNDVSDAVKKVLLKRVHSVVVEKKTPAQVEQLLQSARIVVDECMVGVERLPVEAVMCGAVLLVANCSNAVDRRDFMIPPHNVLPHGAPPSAWLDLVQRTLDSWPMNVQGYNKMQQHYFNHDRHAMANDVRAFLATIPSFQTWLST